MRRFGMIIWLVCLCCFAAAANDTIPIPLRMSTFQYMPNDDPTGSTPDPTDPNQFRASLTGNTLLIKTQENAVSFVVVQEEESNKQGKDYFYGLSYGSITCPITRAGSYTIRIGYWKTDFVGLLFVQSASLLDFSGHYWGNKLEDVSTLPTGFYIFRLQTKDGTTTTKFYRLP